MEHGEITCRNEAIENYIDKRPQFLRKKDYGDSSANIEPEWVNFPERDFRKDWKLLMSVVEKIMAETKDGFHLLPSSTAGFISRFGLRANSRGETPIEATWMAVSDYILEKK